MKPACTDVHGGQQLRHHMQPNSTTGDMSEVVAVLRRTGRHRRMLAWLPSGLAAGEARDVAVQQCQHGGSHSLTPTRCLAQIKH
jgi:hypothetical protein